jgi:hypothetical protein
MNCADSGAGKSGALASLLDEGLQVRVLDFDNGLSTVAGYVKDKSKLKNLTYVTLQDKLKLTGSIVGIQKASAFQRGMDALDGKADAWDGITLPAVTEWTPEHVLVLDTLSMAGRASLQMVMQMNGKGFSAPELQHYGTAMENIEKLVAILTSSAVNCHVIINTHLTSVEGTAKLYPEALGSKLGPKLGKYFDNMITLGVTGGSRTFKTVKDGLFACKTAKPLKDTYPLETGLASIFKDLTGKQKLV